MRLTNDQIAFIVANQKEPVKIRIRLGINNEETEKVLKLLKIIDYYNENIGDDQKMMMLSRKIDDLYTKELPLDRRTVERKKSLERTRCRKCGADTFVKELGLGVCTECGHEENRNGDEYIRYRRKKK